MQKKDIFITELGGLPPILYRGSVKDVRGVVGDSTVIFEYSDRYSVFDWGEMPDLLHNKGIALALLTDCIYQRLEHLGITTHRIGLLRRHNANNCWHVQACERHLPSFSKGTWNYDWYGTVEARNFSKNLLIPLEVVFRLGVTDGSSFLKRATPSYLQSLGLKRVPRPGEMLENVVIEYFTKLEESDRFLNYDEALQVAGLTEDEEKELRQQTLRIVTHLKQWFADLGLTLWDGKLEFAFTPGRKICLVDAIGPDELRLTSQNGLHVSKELLRKYYRDSDWYYGLEKAKTIAHDRGTKDWKSICETELKVAPSPLPKELKLYVENLYMALTNAFTGNDYFSGIPKLEKLLEQSP